MSIVIDARLAGVKQRGIGRYSEEMLRAFDQQPLAETITAIVNEDSLPTLQEKITHLQLVGFVGRWYSFWAEQIRLSARILMSQPTLVYFFHWNVPLPLALALWLLDIPWIVTIHDLILLQRGPERAATTRWYPVYWLKFQVFRALLSIVIRLASTIVVVSETTRRDLLTFFPKAAKKVSVIPEGCEHIDRLLPGARKSIQELDHVRTPLPYVLYVGSTYPHKNLPVLVDAFARVSAELGDSGVALSLLILGSSDRFRDRFYSWSHAQFPGVRIFFIGPVSEQELVQWYCGARAVVLPSTHEGFGLPLVEAFAAGTPVIASDIPALKETAKDAALLFPCADPLALSDQLRAICGQTASAHALRERLQTLGISRARRFRWEHAARSLCDIIAEHIKAPTQDVLWIRNSQIMLWLVVTMAALLVLVFLPSRMLVISFLPALLVATMTARHAGRVLERWVLLAIGAVLLVFLFSAAIIFFSIPALAVFSVELPILLLLVEIAAPTLSHGHPLPRIQGWLLAFLTWEFSIAVSWLALPLLSKSALVILCAMIVSANSIFQNRSWRFGSIAAIFAVISLLLSAYFFR